MTYSKSILIILLISSIFINSQDAYELSNEQAKAIDSIFKSYQDKPGIAVAVVKEGKTILNKSDNSFACSFPSEIHLNFSGSFNSFFSPFLKKYLRNLRLKTGK